MIHNTHMSYFIPPSAFGKTAGTWTPAIGTNLPNEIRTQANATFGLIVPIPLPQNANYHNGAKLKSIDVWYTIAVAADDFATVELEKVTLTATGSIPTGTTVVGTLDTGHDTAAERLAAGHHKMTFTLTTPEFMDDDYVYALYMYVDAAATTDFTIYGARVNYELRLD